MKKIILVFIILANLALSGCSSSSMSKNNYISIFEIPVNDMSRSIHFYEAVLKIKIDKMEFDNFEMGLLPYENQAVTAVLMKGEGYSPTNRGILIYLNAGKNLQLYLDRIVQNGGKVLIPKTPHADNSGYFATFIDSEGNRLGLHSSN